MKNRLFPIVLLIPLVCIVIFGVVFLLVTKNSKTSHNESNNSSSQKGSILDIFEKKPKTGSDFGIETVKSSMDFNENGIDDYTDILSGARKDAENHPRYDGAYQENGYPPDDIGVCTDVIWRALKNAGYDFRKMIDADIKNNLSSYPRVEGKPDSKIDFRRVPNLIVFLRRNATSLTLDVTEIAEWQPGDIVTYGTSGITHCGIVSDKRNDGGRPYIIHNAGQPNREEDALINNGFQDISGHFRFDMSGTDKGKLIAFE